MQVMISLVWRRAASASVSNLSICGVVAVLILVSCGGGDDEGKEEICICTWLRGAIK